MATDGAPLKILLVEDDPTDAQLLRDMLAETGANIELTHMLRLGEALQRLESAIFNVILLDLALEDSGGIDALAKLYAQAPTTPIVALSDHDDEAFGAKALREGVQDCLVKGQVDGRMLVRSIRYAIAHKRMEEALRESEARYRTLVQNLPLSVYEVDRDGLLLSMNQTGLRMMGVQDAVQLSGSTYLDLVPASHRSQFATLMARAFSGELLEIEYTGIVHGQQRVLASTLIPLADSDGTIRTLTGTTEDITERVQVHLDAEMERDRLDAVLESSNDAIMMVDLSNRIALVNRAFSSFFGIEADDLLGIDGEQALTERWDHLDQPQQFLNIVGSLFAHPQREAGGDVTVLRPVERALVWYSGPVYTRAGTSLGRLFIFRDATREKEADLLKTEFISIVSHELRTPLTSIKGYTDLILEGDAGQVNPQVREFLEIVKSSADQLVTVTDDILETSRIEAGKIKLNPRPVAVSEVAHLVADSIQALLSAKQQTLFVDLPVDLPPVYADRDRLMQIFINLLSNAHKYTPPHGSIRVHARLVHQPVDARLKPVEAGGPWVVVGVADTGIGIAAEDQQHLFSRFYRVSNPGTQEIGGTGLGLSIARSLVELQGGAIWVESEPGHGSTFSFSLLANVRSQESAESKPAGVHGDQQLILVVEPVLPIAHLIQRHLERAGYAVMIAASAYEALAVAREKFPALITLASRLPDMDGFALIEQLRARADSANIPVIMISTIEDAERALRLDVAGNLSMPIDERRLIDIVQATLAQDKRAIALVVDDDPQVRQALTALLTKHGFNAFAAPDGQQALTLAIRLQPSLVLLDLWMPGINGFQILNVLKQHPSTHAIPIIAMTDGEIPPQAITRVLSLGATELLTKPLDMEVLERLIAAKLDRSDIIADDTTMDSRTGH